MQIIVDRISYVVILLAAAALIWIFLPGHNSSSHSSLVGVILFSINSAMFARSLYGTKPFPFSREFSIVGFWLSVLALEI